MRATIGIVAVLAIAGLFILGGAIVLRNFEAVVGDIRATLAYVAPPPAYELQQIDGMESGSLDLVSHEPLSDTERGIKFAIQTMLLGGLPASLLALVLARRSDARQTRWTGWWAQAFLAGFVFQLGSLFFASMVLLGIAIDGGWLLVGDLHSVIFASAFLLNVICSARALRAWHRLHASVAQERLTLA